MSDTTPDADGYDAVVFDLGGVFTDSPVEALRQVGVGKGVSFEEAMDVEPAAGAAAVGVADAPKPFNVQRKSAAPPPTPAEEIQGEANEDWPFGEELKKGGKK